MKNKDQMIKASIMRIIPPTGMDAKLFMRADSPLPTAVPKAMAAIPKKSELKNIITGEIPAIPALIPIKIESADRAIPIAAPSAGDMLLELSQSDIFGSFITSA